MTTIVHGQPATTTGLSGAGTRSVVADIFDHCTDSSPTVLWTNSNPDIGTDVYAYSTGFGGVPMPHARATKYAVGECADSETGNCFLDKSVTFPGTRKVFLSAYRRMHPSWPFGASCDGDPSTDDDNNLKWMAVAAGGGLWELPDWYHDNGLGQKCSLTATQFSSLYSSGGLGNMAVEPPNLGPNRAWGGVSDQSHDPWYNWVKMEWRFILAASNATFKFLINNELLHDHSSLNSDDAAGTQRNIGIGNYSRQRAPFKSNAYTYMADIVLAAGADAWKRAMLANNATFTNATITESQEILSWADGSVTYKVNQGALSLGQNWLTIWDDTDTIIHTESVTIESGASAPGGGLAMPTQSPKHGRMPPTGGAWRIPR